MTSVLVTGATGYLGKALVRRLAESGDVVHAVVREGTNPVGLGKVILQRHDGTTSGMIELFEATQPEVVVHLATTYRRHHTPADLDDMVRSNVEFGTQLLEAMTRTGVGALINTGSYFEYGDGGTAVNLYAAMKRAFGEIVDYYLAEGGIRAVTLVPSDVYGPGDDRPKLIPKILDSLTSGEEIRLAANDPAIDLVHIEDVVGAYIDAIGGLAGGDLDEGRFDVSSGEPLRLSEVVALVESLSATTLNVIWEEAPASAVTEAFGSRQWLPGWHPRFSLREGLAGLLTELSD